MKYANARRKDAVVRELACMGISQTGIARLVGRPAPMISQICRRVGVKPTRERSGWEPQRKKSRERAANMLALYRAGRTLEEIGQQFGLTRERVRQLMTKHFGTRQNDGGQHARMERRRQRREAARNIRCLKKWGCGWDQYVAIRDMKKPTRAYASQMRNAHKRGIKGRSGVIADTILTYDVSVGVDLDRLDGRPGYLDRLWFNPRFVVFEPEAA